MRRMTDPRDAVEILAADLRTVWAALVAAQDHMVVHGTYEVGDENPKDLVAKARVLVESALDSAGGPSGFYEV